MITQRLPGIARPAIALLALLILCGCAGQPQAPAEPPAREARSGVDPVGERAARVALGQVGTPYRFGGSTVRGFDCSGLVQYSYARAGKKLPRTTGALWSVSRTVHNSDLQPGDLLFFNIEGKMSHVGLYLGDREFVHAPSSGQYVSVASMDAPFYSAALLRVGRPD